MPQSPDHPTALDILAIAAHRDDVEQTCGGTLLKHAQRGLRCGILDLTRGEMGTRGTSADRARESAEAARLLQVCWRAALDIPDGRVENTWENRLKLAFWIRMLRPRILILPYWQGRHPDHYTAATLGYEACFAAGLKKLEIPREAAGSIEVVTGIADDQLRTTATQLPAFRPFKIVYASLYADVRPSFVVDITEQFETRTQALFCYQSQYREQATGAGLFPHENEIRGRLEAMARFYGLLAGLTYAEPFVQKEIGVVEDLLSIPVQSI